MTEHKNKKRKIFITITLYLLLAFAFFQNYWGATSVGALIFIIGILTLIPLTFIYYNGKDNSIWAWFWMIPFISLLLFNLTRLYGIGLGIKSKGITFFWKTFLEFIRMESLSAILIFMIFFLIMVAIVTAIKK